MRLTIVDVFAERRLAGNQLAVVRDAATLTTAEMQAIALEMNFSETTFVVEEGPSAAKVRIFTPAHELPFAGHPTLGTAWVLASGRGDYTLKLAAGDVKVVFESDGRGWIAPPMPKLGGTLAREQAAKLVGLKSGDIDANLPIQLADRAPKFVLVPLMSIDLLGRARLDLAAHRTLVAEGLLLRDTFAFCFAPGSHAPGGDYAARMFFEANGEVREDPATGSANACLAAYLQAWGRNAAVVDQGVEMGRPSRLYLEMGARLRVGGRVQAVAEGRLL